MPDPLRVLITAGPTREHLDPVRFLSNESSGRMGIALVEAALARGLRVSLVHGPIALAPPADCVPHAVLSAAQMLSSCKALWPEHDLLLMAAAVADYAPAECSPHKITKSDQPLLVRLTPTPDVLAALAAAKRPDQTVVGFALEDQDGRSRAEAKLRRKALDGIVLNSPAALNAAESQVELFAPGPGWQTLPYADKGATARLILDWALRL